VMDDSSGIAPEEHERIFQRFVRLGNGDRPEVQGMGLGLSGVKLLLETMGGEIHVESRQGTGACFTIRIPPLYRNVSRKTRP
jgi:signal transduction histidine kinase